MCTVQFLQHSSPFLFREFLFQDLRTTKQKFAFIIMNLFAFPDAHTSFIDACYGFWYHYCITVLSVHLLLA